MLDLRVDNARLYPMEGSAQRSASRSFGVRQGRIVAAGPDSPAHEELDARDRVVLPGFIDCHTHALYAGDRMSEHLRKLAGASYAEIAQSGGGILSTVRAVREASRDQLVEQTRPRLAALEAEGVTTVEIKSGYGLSVEHEIKMLEAIRDLAEQTPQRIVPTFLGAHSVPPGVTREQYIGTLVDEALPLIAERRLAEAVDIFIESIAFSVEDARRLFERARELGLRVKGHCEQLSLTGASALAASFDALSCDHLEYLDAEGARAMAKAGTVAVLLPGAFYFLRETRKPPIALLREHGVPLAIASDLNPGTSPIPSLLTNLHMAVTFFGVTPEEALLGITYNAARALGREDIGALVPGRRADFTLWNVPEPGFLAYQLGGLAPESVYIEGQATCLGN
ncbi:MAG TPA: imidazolonepropionase [Steroidobacteraceae bacterium]|nr:imidazolonepropionase [Steroidobacteraceae bacterium]